jgi:hypothetical protein
MSALLRITDSTQTSRHVRFVPRTEIATASEMQDKPCAKASVAAYLRDYEKWTKLGGNRCGASF